MAFFLRIRCIQGVNMKSNLYFAKTSPKNFIFVVILILSSTFLMGCNPSQFQVDTSSSNEFSNATPNVNGNNTGTSATETTSSKLSCVLSANNTQVRVGDDVKFSFNTNFDIPKNAQMTWTGKSFGIEITTPQDQSKFFLNLGLSYRSELQAGIHKRQIKLIDSNGNLICSSNLLKVEFIGDIAADQICTQIGGQLSGDDNEVCSVEAWRLYREMTSRNLINSSGSQSENNLGMANPAAVYCNNIGGKHETSSSLCNIDKYKLQGLYNGTPGRSPSVKPLSGKDVTALSFSYYSGTVSPAYQYSVGFKLDLLRKTVQVSVTKGSSVSVALPAPGMRSLTNNQVSHLKSLLSSMPASNCDGQAPQLGEQVSSLAIYTLSSYHLDSYIWLNSCQPFSEVQNQYMSSSQDAKQVVDFLKSL